MNRKQQGWSAISLYAAVLAWSCMAAAQEDTELARETENPLAKLVTVPLQNNWDFGIGPNEAMRYTVKLQPIIPFPLDTNWYIMTRTILPLTYAESSAPGDDSKLGLEDTSLSLFLSPRRSVYIELRNML